MRCIELAILLGVGLKLAGGEAKDGELVEENLHEQSILDGARDESFEKAKNDCASHVTAFPAQNRSCTGKKETRP